MITVNTIDEILVLAENYRENPKDFLNLWHSYIKDYPEIEKMCLDDMNESGHYDFMIKEVDDALTIYLSNFTVVSKNFDEVVGLVEESLMKICPLAKDTEVYLYLGLSNGAGWATEINGHGAILLGIEKIVGLKWHTYEKMKSLIAHELAHETHRLFRNESIDKDFSDMKYESIWDIYSEGYAQFFQQRIAQDKSYHQDEGSWLKFCLENEDRLKLMYYDRVMNSQSTNDFFGDWNNIEGYSDVGYYLGSKWIESMIESKTMEDIAKLTLNDLESKFVEFFGAE